MCPLGCFQVLDARPYNHKADVYSFGICLWEMYKCDMPYFNLSASQMEAIVKQVWGSRVGGLL